MPARMTLTSSQTLKTRTLLEAHSSELGPEDCINCMYIQVAKPGRGTLGPDANSFLMLYVSYANVDQ